MFNIKIFFGPKREFDKLIKDVIYTTLSKAVKESEDKKNFLKVVQNDHVYENEKVEIKNLVVFSDEYMSVREHVIANFEGFISNFEVENLFFHNPPSILKNKLVNSYENISIEIFEYPKMNDKILKNIYFKFNEKIIGQEKARNKVISSLIPLRRKNNTKPIILMFYGPSGVGKTASAKFIASKLGGELLRQQCSMFQNSEFITYLFGGKHYEKCFAKELLERETNVILLDEFDKAPSVFHSAFYQLFDEGIFEDKNYTVKLDNTIIICTSNYSNIREIQKELGDPIYSRFNQCVEFDSLTNGAIEKIMVNLFNEHLQTLEDEERELFSPELLLEMLLSKSSMFKNVRNISNIINELISLEILNTVSKKYWTDDIN